MTIDERVAKFVAELKAGTKHTLLAERYLAALLEVARDQRHAGIKAVGEINVADNGLIDPNAACQAINDATIK